MSRAMPSYYNSEWYDKENDKLLDGAPQEIIDEYELRHSTSDVIFVENWDDLPDEVKGVIPNPALFK